MSLFAMSSRIGAQRRPGGRRYRPLLESLEGRAVPSTVAGDVHLPIAIAEVAKHPRAIDPSVEPSSGNLKGLESSAQNQARGLSLAAPPFGTVKTYDASSNPSDVVSFTENGSLYLAVLNHDKGGKGGVTILRGNGAGGFTFVHRYDMNWDPDSLAEGEFTANGIPDLAVAREIGGDIEVLLGTNARNGTFSFGGKYSSGANPTFVTVANLTKNGNGPADLIVANRGRGVPGAEHISSVSVLVGNGNGTFQPAKQYFAGSRPLSLAVADFNGDGKLDIAVTSSDTNYIGLLMGNGDGTFQPPSYLYVGYHTGSITAGDFNNNSKLDLVVGSVRNRDELSVFSGNGYGGFSLLQTIPLVSYPSTLTAADLKGTGALDLVTALSARGEVDVLDGKGNGTFSQPLSFYVGHHPVAVTVADVNNDGIPDLITANQHGGNVGVLLGRRT